MISDYPPDKLWKNHPNRSFIISIIKSSKEYPEIWKVSFEEESLEWTPARDAAMEMLGIESPDWWWSGACEAIVALLAWPGCSYMLDSELDELRLLSKFGNHAATFMMPAARAFGQIRKLNEHCR